MLLLATKRRLVSGTIRRVHAPARRFLRFLVPALAFAALLGGLVLAPATARAQRHLDTQLFLPPPGGGSTFTIARTAIPRHVNAVFGFGANYALEPAFRGGGVDTDGTLLPSSPVVPHMLQMEVMAALGLFEIVEIGLVVPFAVLESANDILAADYTYSTAIGFGDIRLEAKAPLVRGDFSMAARFVAVVPTGDFNNFLSMDYWVGVPSLIFEGLVGPLTFAAELGYRMKQRRRVGDLVQDDELQLTAGLAARLAPEVELIGETLLRAGVGAGDEFAANNLPWEVDAGARFWPTQGLSIEVGAGTGILAGWGAPVFRAFTSLRFATDEGNGCQFGPEDFDGFDDGDFCADLDNDDDGILDGDDRCPNDAEDLDRFRDDDGCPDTDNDADGVVDEEDSCPTQSEDRDGFQDEDGCPEPDNDGDGIADGSDRCPMEAEDLDNFEDDDGCPEPGPQAATVTVTDTRILISQRIYFDFDTDTIRSVSTPMLDQVAATILDLGGELRVRVDGYTDNQGVAAYNLDLSYRRARSVVEYLVGRGVPRARAEYRGYGSENPVAPNDSEEGRALNRRVEFTILQAGESAGRRRR